MWSYICNSKYYKQVRSDLIRFASSNPEQDILEKSLQSQ